MGETTCILCGRNDPVGLHVMGCLICFPCEKRLLSGTPDSHRRRRLLRLYSPAEG